MAYDNSSGLITAPVSIKDLQDCFRVRITVDGADAGNSSDLGMNIYGATGQSYTVDNKTVVVTNREDINKWAKYKPVVRSSIDTVTGQWDATNNRWLSTASWWKGDDGHCGLTFTPFTSIGTLNDTNSFLYKLTHLQLPWTYTKPSGGSISPFRLSDFAQYYADAVEPVGRLAGAGRTVYVPANGQGSRTLTLNYDAPASGDSNLTLADFAHGGVSFQQFYLAVAMIKGSRCIVASSVNPIGNTGSTVIETSIGYNDIGTWQVIPFLSSVIINAYEEEQTGTYISAGYASLDTIILADSGSIYQINASASWSNTAYTQLGIQAIIKNNSSASKTFNGGVTFYIYETNLSATSGAEGTLKAQYTYSTTFTVNANSEYTIPANQYNQLLDDYFIAFMTVTREQGKEYWITARFEDGTSITNNYEPVEDQIMPE